MPSEEKRRNEILKQAVEQKIGTLCQEHKFHYGHRKITALLRQEMSINPKTIQSAMQEYGWQCRVKRKKRRKTGQPYYKRATGNLLNRA